MQLILPIGFLIKGILIHFYVLSINLLDSFLDILTPILLFSLWIILENQTYLVKKDTSQTTPPPGKSHGLWMTPYILFIEYYIGMRMQKLCMANGSRDWLVSVFMNWRRAECDLTWKWWGWVGPSLEEDWGMGWDPPWKRMGGWIHMGYPPLCHNFEI